MCVVFSISYYCNSWINNNFFAKFLNFGNNIDCLQYLLDECNYGWNESLYVTAIRHCKYNILKYLIRIGSHCDQSDTCKYDYSTNKYCTHGHYNIKHLQKEASECNCNLVINWFCHCAHNNSSQIKTLINNVSRVLEKSNKKTQSEEESPLKKVAL